MADTENQVPEGAVHSTRPKRPPPITPKRFTRFFTPRTSSGRSNKTSLNKASRTLRDITQNAINRKGSQKSSTKKTVLFADVTKHDSLTSTPNVDDGKKRKGAFPTPISSPMQSSPCKRMCLDTIQEPPSSPPSMEEDDDEDERLETIDESPRSSPEPTICLPIRKPRKSGLTTRMLERSFGVEDRINYREIDTSRTRWESQTANFHSTPEDAHSFVSPALPFCTTSCNTNSLVAIGDEDGGVRLIESDRLSNADFSRRHIYLHPHRNAILDLAFSSDDQLLASASGDQTVRIIDMHTQATRFVLSGHSTSVKQVRFQPGNDNVLATSSRDGNIHIWDTRCHGPDAVVTEMKVAVGDDASQEDVNVKVTYPTIYTTMASAHQDRSLQYPQRSDGRMDIVRDFESCKDSPTVGRRGDISITSLSFLSAGREHLLLSASDASTSVKLWDIRSRYSRRAPAVPISTARQPDSHNRHRRFGVSSIVVGGDASRLYTLSRDNTIYAYSTSHLILGTAPEFSTTAESRSKSSNPDRLGLGPLYGFRHPQFHVATFYVKMDLRPARNDQPEMLAVGSSDRCAVLFPTNEALFGNAAPKSSGSGVKDLADGDPLGTPRLGATNLSSPFLPSSITRPGLFRTPSSFASRMADTIPIHNVGTALVGGHSREVTSVTWSADGQLITLSDDYTARRWHEDAAQARDLRCGGEGEGRRWRCGWAEAGPEYDEDDW